MTSLELFIPSGVIERHKVTKACCAFTEEAPCSSCRIQVRQQVGHRGMPFMFIALPRGPPGARCTCGLHRRQKHLLTKPWDRNIPLDQASCSFVFTWAPSLTLRTRAAFLAGVTAYAPSPVAKPLSILHAAQFSSLALKPKAFENEIKFWFLLYLGKRN